MIIKDIDKDGKVQGEYNASKHLDEAYNLAIDHAVTIIDENMKPYYDPHSEMIKQKLQALKKNQ